MEPTSKDSVKLAYCQIINSDLLKLTEEQLFKVLTLVKNTVQSSVGCNELPLRLKNKCMCPPTDLITHANNISPEMNAEAKIISEILYRAGFWRGYGIVSIPRMALSESADCYAYCVCFCVPNRLDCMLTIYKKTGGGFFYKLKTAEAGNIFDESEIELYTLAQVEEAIKNIKENITNNTNE